MRKETNWPNARVRARTPFDTTFSSHRHNALLVGVYRLQRFDFGKSSGVNSAADGHTQQEEYCKAKGGRLPTWDELCPDYNKDSASDPTLGCEDDHSWVSYEGNTNNWMYIGCDVHGHWECKDHVAHFGAPNWVNGDVYGEMVDCMVEGPIYTCTCVNGVATTGADCTTNGASICASCSAGYTMNEAGTACGGLDFIFSMHCTL